MSEVSRAVINMPYELAMSSELSRRQFHGIAQSMQSDHDKRVAELEAEIAEARRLLKEYGHWSPGVHIIHAFLARKAKAKHE